jgi:hypothetical protein
MWTVIFYIVAFALQVLNKSCLQFQASMVTTNMNAHVRILPREKKNPPSDYSRGGFSDLFTT